jgi:predicted DNA-binding transcriptional regulator AlpA
MIILSPKQSSDDPKVKMAKKMSKDRSISIAEICATLRISRATLYRYVSMPETA